MWERGSSFIKKAGTIILLSTIVLWFLQGFGWEKGAFGMVDDIDHSILSSIGQTFAWIFSPLGWGDWKAAVASVTGLIAKENVVATFDNYMDLLKLLKKEMNSGDNYLQFLHH